MIVITIMEDSTGEFPGQPTLVFVNPDDLTRKPNLLQGILQSPRESLPSAVSRWIMVPF